MSSSTVIQKISAISFGAVLSVAALGAQQAQAAPFSVTIEAPTVQESSLVTDPGANPATGVTVENFDGQTVVPNFQSNSQYYSSLNSSLGVYENSVIVKNEVWGGSKGSQYMEPNGQATLKLNSAQRYFGMWWSAGDATNILDFYSGDSLLHSFTTADVISFLQAKPDSSAYYGNPNANYQGRNTNEPYAFLNFYADPNNLDVTFDKIVFTHAQFESDNHTIAKTYGKTSGTSIYEPESTPEPASILGLVGMSLLGLVSARKRQQP